MGSAHRSFNDNEWTWENDGQHHAVRWFPQQGGLIWSMWVETQNGPAFSDGIRQRAEDFLSRGAPDGHPLPDDIAEAIRRALKTPAASPDNGIWARLRRRLRQS